jgi:tetratricopeptide (TPR) repeat protein
VVSEQETHAGRDVHAAARDLMVVHQHAADNEHSQAQGPPARGDANDQVVVGNIPRQPHEYQPRADLMAELSRAHGRVSVGHATAEMQGVGTTQLAAAYARAKLTEGWRLVAWVDAEDVGSLNTGLAAVADVVRPYAGGSGRRSVNPGQMVRHWLEADGNRCLLVFNDANDPDVLRPFVPAGGAARVVITSTRPSVANLGTNVSVDVFSADEALAVLTERTGLIGEGEAAAVAAELGNLPLAMTQAAAVIAGRRIGYGTYLKQLRALLTEKCVAREPGQSYPRGVAEAVLLSLQEVSAADHSGTCSRMMEIMTVLSATGVRRELLHAAGQAGLLAEGGHCLAAPMVDQALAQLAERSLLTFSLGGQTILIHRLVTRVARDELIRQGRFPAVCRAAASVLEAHARVLVGSQDRPAARDFPEQVAALLENTPGLATETDEELAGALLRLRFFALYNLIQLGESAPQAVEYGKQLTADFEQLLGREHPDTLNSRNSLAAAYQLAGQHAVAIPIFESTLAARERALGPDHPGTLTSRHNLAAAYHLAGSAAEAIPLFELALAARDRVLGPDHPSTLTSRAGLATAYRDAGRLAEAIPLFELTLAAREPVLGPDHSDTLTSRNNLANAYRDAGQISEAIPLIEQMLAARERMLGADHPKTLASRNNLAVAYRATRRIAAAIPLLEKNLAACERILGADHPRTQVARHNLALAQQDAVRAE